MSDQQRYSNADRNSQTRKETEKKYFGNYLGIVIQNDDPQQRGRVKVWVPHINCSVYSNWDKLSKDRKFKIMGSNIESDLSDILHELKAILPWGNVMSPVVGAAGSGRYNANLDTASISDSAQVRTITPRASGDDDKHPFNKDNIGEKPARLYEIDKYKVSDAFSTTKSTRYKEVYAIGDDDTRGMPNKVNKFTSSYIPKSYSNMAKGSFSIPNVGAHVWVFFEDGNHNRPVTIGVSHGKEDWRGIYDSWDGEHGIDYPGSYENRSVYDDTRYDNNTVTYRNKYVLNQKGGTFEICSTDSKELLKLTHYSGSFMEMNNQATIELCTGVAAKDVLSDLFLTVGGHRNEYSERDYDLITRGDFYHKIGTHPIDKFTLWREKVKEIADLKQLFDVKRCAFDQSRNIYFQKTAPGQEKVGTPAPCPLCSAEGREPIWDVKGDSLTQSIPMLFNSLIGPFGPAAKLGAKFLSQFIKPFGPQDPFDVIQPPSNPGNFLGDGPCPVCKGTGLSPASEGGKWDPQGSNESGLPILTKDGKPIGKDGVVQRKYLDLANELAQIEKDMGLGGSMIVDITKHKVETIGLLMNDFPAIRIDEEGVAAKNEIKVFKEGVAGTFTTSPVIEQVHVDDLPGGTYTLNVMSRYNCTVGAGGVSIKTLGNMDIGGAIMNFAGEQINMSSDNDFNIAAKRVNISADILSLRQKKYKQVVIDSNLGVNQNVVVGGGMHVEGELTVQHITGPAQENVSSTESPKGTPIEGRPIGKVAPMAGGLYVTIAGAPVPVQGYEQVQVIGINSPGSLQVDAHPHKYKTVAFSAESSHDAVRNVGKNCNMPQRIGPAPVQNDDLSGLIADVIPDIPMPDILES